MDYRLEQRIDSYRVDSADLRIGHVEIERAVVHTLRTHQAGPFLLRTADPAIEIREATAESPFLDRLTLPGSPDVAGDASTAIDCRVLLTADTRPATYPLDLQLELFPVSL